MRDYSTNMKPLEIIIFISQINTAILSSISNPLQPNGEISKIIPDYFDNKKTKPYHEFKPINLTNISVVHCNESCNVVFRFRWSSSVGSSVFSTPVIFPAGVGGKKHIFQTTYYHYLEMIGHDGFKPWGWPLTFEKSSFQGSPVLYDVDGDGYSDVGIADKNANIYWVRVGEFGQYIEDYTVQVPRLKVERDWTKTSSIYGDVRSAFDHKYNTADNNATLSTILMGSRAIPDHLMTVNNAKTMATVAPYTKPVVHKDKNRDTINPSSLSRRKLLEIEESYVLLEEPIQRRLQVSDSGDGHMSIEDILKMDLRQKELDEEQRRRDEELFIQEWEARERMEAEAKSAQSKSAETLTTISSGLQTSIQQESATSRVIDNQNNLRGQISLTNSNAALIEEERLEARRKQLEEEQRIRDEEYIREQEEEERLDAERMRLLEEEDAVKRKIAEEEIRAEFSVIQAEIKAEEKRRRRMSKDFAISDPVVDSQSIEAQREEEIVWRQQEVELQLQQLSQSKKKNDDLNEAELAHNALEKRLREIAELQRKDEEYMQQQLSEDLRREHGAATEVAFDKQIKFNGGERIDDSNGPDFPQDHPQIFEGLGEFDDDIRSYGFDIFEERGFVFVDAHVLGSPVLVDVNNDGRPELFVAVSYYFDRSESRNIVHNFDPDLYIGCGLGCWDLHQKKWMWLVHLDLSTDKTSFKALIHSTPTVADLDGDGNYEVIIGTSLGLLYVIEAHTGFTKPYFPMQFHELQSQIAVADVMGDLDLEIIVNDMSGNIVIVNHTGDVIWDLQLSGSLPHTPTVGDIDGDGELDIVVVAISNNITHIWALRGGNGTSLTGYPVSLPPSSVATSSALLADLTTYDTDSAVAYYRRPSDPHTPVWVHGSEGHESPDSDIQGFELDKTSPSGTKQGAKLYDFGKNGSNSQHESPKQQRNYGLHLVVSSFDGHVYIIDGVTLCAQRIDLGEHIFAMPLLDDVTGDGFLDLLVGTISGQVVLLESSIPSHSVAVWSSFPRGRINGFTYGQTGISVPLAERERLRSSDISFNLKPLSIAEVTIIFDIWDRRLPKAVDDFSSSTDRRYTVSFNRGTKREYALLVINYTKPGRYQVRLPINPPEELLLVVGLTNEHGQYYEDVLPVSVGTKFYVWIKYLVAAPTMLLSLPLILYRRQEIANH